MEKILLIDGHSILSRAFYGIPLLTASTGIHTNAVYGFLNIMFKCIDEEKADYIAVAFDLERQKLKRTALYPEYKGTRKPMPTELLEQVPLIQQILKAMKLPIMTLEGYEADDILGTAAKRAQAAGYDVVIVSGDRDLLQLCDTHIKLSIPKTSKGKTETFTYYPEDVRKEYRVTPKEFIDLKALMGDTSDNIPGLPGVGPKTAGDIIEAYGSIENAYAHADEIRPPRAQKALKENYHLAELSKVLATIDIQAPLEMELTAGKVNSVYTNEALALLRELELKTLAARFSKHAEDADAASAGTLDLSGVKTVKDPFMAGIACRDSEEEESIGLAVFMEEAGEEQYYAVGLALTSDRVYVITSGKEYPADALRADIEKLLQKRIEKGKRVLTLNLKEQLKYISVPRNEYIEDLSIRQYLLDPNRNSYEYDDLLRDYCSAAVEGKQELVGKKLLSDMLGMNRVGQMSLFGEEPVPEETKKKKAKAEAADPAADKQNAVKYVALNALAPLLADRKLTAAVKKAGMEKLFREIEMPLVYSLHHMEAAGIEVNRASLDEYAKLLKSEIDVLTDEIFALAGEKFNINSPSQLGVILFEKLGIPGAKKTKSGYSTAADVLEKAADQHEIVPKVLRYRALTKLHSTYAAGLADYIRSDGRIHGTFNQTVTATGRISSTDPNLQNIPVRTQEGKEIRRVFVPKKGYTFVDADYSQVELRILAALSGDETLIAAYKNAVDVHTLTASQVFHVPVDEVTPEQRRNAKAVNFGIVYGISAFGLGEGLSISRKEAQEYISKYFESYPKVKEYLDRCVAEAKVNGFVATKFGRIRPIPELKSSNFMQRSFGERIAMNSPIQGTAADIMKIAMNKTDAALSGMKSRIVLQVHDELLIETAPEELEDVKKIVEACMEEAADLPVRLSTEVKSGDTWYDCH